MDATAKSKRLWWQTCLAAWPVILVLPPLLLLMLSGTSLWSAEGSSSTGLFTVESFEHGWPFTFLRRLVVRPQASRWAVWEGDKEWHWAGGAGDLALLTAVSALILFVTIRRARQNRVWHLSLRECLSAMLLIAVIAGHLGWCVRRGEQALAVGKRLEALQARVEYEYSGPKWLQRIRAEWLDRVTQKLPLESIRSVDLASVERPDMEAACKLLREVDHPRAVTLEFTAVNEAAFQLVLESLAKCQPEEMSLNELKLEGFMGEPWSVDLLKPLARNPRLRHLKINGTGIGDQEVPALLACVHLRSLDLRATRLTPRGIQKLLALPELEEIFILEDIASAELRERAVTAGVQLDVLKIEPYVKPTFSSGFGGGPTDAAKGAGPKK